MIIVETLPSGNKSGGNLKIKICNENKIKNMFIKADLNNDGYLSIDEFIEFLFIIMSYWKK